MKEYTQQDFQMYFHRSWFRHPETGELVSNGGFLNDGTNDILVNSTSGTLTRLDYTKIKWEHVKLPPLGYRHVRDGMYLIYVAKIPAQDRPKGLHVNKIRVALVPDLAPVCRALGTEAGYQEYRELNPAVAAAIHEQKFITLNEAIKGLTTSRLAAGFALSPSVAVILGSTADAPFVTLFKNQRAAISKDGHAWTIFNPELKEVLNRHGFRL